MIILVPLSQEVLHDVNSLKNKFIDILMNLFERILKYFGIWKKKKKPRKEPLLNLSYQKIVDIDLEDPLPRNCKICKTKFRHLDYVVRRNSAHFYFCCEKCYFTWLEGTTGTATI